MTRTEIINAIIARYSYKSYLELGVQFFERNYSRVQVETKHGVDINPYVRCTHHMTTDEFFASTQDAYDLIFVDADHRALPALRDLVRAIGRINDNGCVVFHDCNPESEAMLVPSMNGTAWVAWAVLRCSRPDLEMVVVDTDYGVGVIRRGRQELFAPEEDQAGLPCYFGADHQFTWEFLEAHRQRLLNLVSEEEFMKRLNDTEA